MNAYGPLTIFGSHDTRDWVPGKELLARPNAIKDPNGIDLDNAEYQWLRNGYIIQGATDQRYTLTEADVSREISVMLTYTDGAGNKEVVTSKPTRVPVPIRQLGLVELAYKEILGRTPDGPGWEHYKNMLSEGVPRWQVIQYIELSPEARSRNA